MSQICIFVIGGGFNPLSALTSLTRFGFGFGVYFTRLFVIGLHIQAFDTRCTFYQHFCGTFFLIIKYIGKD